MTKRITITLGNSLSKINGLTKEELTSLRKELSYKIDFATARYIPNPANRTKYCIDLKGNYGTGLQPRVNNWLKKHNLTFLVQYVGEHVHYLPLVVAERAFKSTLPFAPYPDQAQALETIKVHARGILSLPTGTGKSFIIAMLLAEFKTKTLIVVPTLELKTQLIASLSEYLTTMKHITVENIDSKALLTATDYECLIIDEAHHVAAKTYHNLNKTAWNSITKRYFFTATPFRNNTEETLLFESIAGEVIYELTYPEAVKNNYIVPVEAYYYNVPHTHTDRVLYTGVYHDLVYDNKYRNKLIAKIITALYHNDKHCLCLVKEIKHGQILSELTGIPFANGADEDSREWINIFNSGKLKCLIGTTGILSEGVDTKPAEYVIIAGLGKAKSNIMQSIGRGVRKYPGKESCKVIIFKDKSHKFTLRHFKEQCKIIKEEYLTEPIELEIKDETT